MVAMANRMLMGSSTVFSSPDQRSNFQAARKRSRENSGMLRNFTELERVCQLAEKLDNDEAMDRDLQLSIELSKKDAVGSPSQFTFP